MSAWPQAVWIVRRMKKYFNIDYRVDKCSDELNNINANINTATDLLDQFDNKISDLRNIDNLQQTLDKIDTDLNDPENGLKAKIANLQNLIINMHQTPAIFDKDIDDNPNVPDHHEEEFTNSSVWFIEGE